MTPGHHAIPAHESVLLLQTDAEDGLSSQTAQQRLRDFGPNTIPKARGEGWLRRWLRQFHNPLIYVLLVSGFVTLLLGSYVDSAVIFGVVLVNAVIGYVQESKAESALDALSSLVETRARVIRDGTASAVPSPELVPGDLVVIEAGDKVPADVRLVAGTDLRADESALTGESVPVLKEPLVLPEDTEVADRINMLYSGTLATSGTGRGVAVATGGETEIGEIHRLVGTADTLSTPLTRKLEHFSKLLTVAILGLAVLAFGVGIARGESVADMMTAAVALAVGAIPEGLPAAVTITLAIGVSRMAARRAVVRRLPVVETLGSTTVICTDKTGTLTQNEMTVQEVWAPGQDAVVSGEGYGAEGQIRVRDAADSDAATGPVLEAGAADGSGVDGQLSPVLATLIAGTLCNDAHVDDRGPTRKVVGDPTEVALLVAAGKAGLDVSAVRARYPRASLLPFDSALQMMATRHRGPVSDLVVVKGSPETVREVCTAQVAPDGGTAPLDGELIESEAHRLAASGLRVLAFAIARSEPGATLPDPTPDDLAADLVLVGLQAMWDPPRAAAAAAVQACHTAGVSVRMITGDHAGTAVAVANQVGIGQGERALSGRELRLDHDGSIIDRVEQTEVFARVTPEQKLTLVRALQSRDEVVAMTGDGVNDAPALRQADIGIAMGMGGTEVAQEAADMVLVDDDFATIEAAVEEGRGVFDNITKFIAWTLPTNLGEGFVILAAILIGSALPILPVQILWINMTTAVLLGLTLAFEPKEAGIMQRPPRDPGTPLLTRTLLVRIVLVSAVLVAASWWIFQTILDAGGDIDVARTAAMNTFVVIEAFYLFSCRSLTESAWRLGWFSNRWLIGGVIVQTIAQILITYAPFMNYAFETAPLGWEVWIRILLLGAAASIVIAMHKRLSRRPPR